MDHTLEHQNEKFGKLRAIYSSTLPVLFDYHSNETRKEWPLSKWIKINTSSPYKRAFQLIKKASL